MKLPFTFATRLIFRLVIPGLVLFIILYPIFHKLINYFNISEKETAICAFLVIAFGYFIFLLDMHIYMIFEGRRYWPRLLWNFFHRRERYRLICLYRARKKAIA